MWLRRVGFRSVCRTLAGSPRATFACFSLNATQMSEPEQPTAVLVEKTPEELAKEAERKARKEAKKAAKAAKAAAKAAKKSSQGQGKKGKGTTGGKGKAQAQGKKTKLGMSASKTAAEFPEWYDQVIRYSEMLSYYTEVSGCYVLRPNALFVWNQ
ncbi:MAG: hypothetical protein MHM6MM_006814, partial [Cercozoa sp. M6MM]